MESMNPSALARIARERYRIIPMSSQGQVHDYLMSLGAREMSDKFRNELIEGDEFVDPLLVEAAFTITEDQVPLLDRATEAELENFVDDPDDPFNPLEYGPDQEAWTVFQHELSTLRRVCVVLERDPDNRDLPGQYRVFGAGQWLRELLWAATGVIPRDPGDPQDPLFMRALESARK